MKVSYNWLKSYIDFDHTPEALGDIMTSLGLEVEGLEEVESVKGGLKGVVIGKVIEKENHPDADRLSVTKVDIGGDDLLQIVCGAPNVAAGQKVVIATIGTTLYDADLNPWKIKKGKIRGQLSEGMICAEDELHLGQSHDGIMVLPDDATIGQAAAEHFDVGSDWVYDVGLTPNRSDATSHIGTARDLLAYFRFHVDAGKELTLPQVDDLSVKDGDLPIEVAVNDTVACPRYSGVCLSDLKIGPSPQWIKERLEAIGVRSINNVVDITNYVLQEYGQPLHAFDYDKIAGHKIIVDKLEEGTPFTTLDEVERKLSADDLMICDGNGQPMCIGGVFGGIHSGVTDGTTRIFLESAHFEAIGIRKSSTNHLLRTDAAKCFEKGADPNRTVDALQRAVLLLKEYAGAKVVSELIDIYPNPISPVEIDLNIRDVQRLIGVDLPKEKIEAILSAMDMSFESGVDTIKVKVPTDKADVTRPADLVEEILRIYGMDTVVFDDRHNFSVNVDGFKSSYEEREKISEFLVGKGFNEIMGLSLMKKDHFEGRNDLVVINNTSNVHLNILRPSMLLSALDSVAFNINRQQGDLRFFEFGKAYSTVQEKYKEVEELVLLMTGQVEDESWRADTDRTSDVFDIKAETLSVLSKCGIQGYQISDKDSDELAYGQKLHRGPQVIAEFGKVDTKWTSAFGIKQDVYAAMFSWKALVKGGFKSYKVEEVSKFPSVRRDLALVVAESVAYGEMEQIARKCGGKLLTNIDLFDVYRNDEHLGAGKKSYALKLIFSDPTKTLKDKEVDKMMEKMINDMSSKLNAEVRR